MSAPITPEFQAKAPQIMRYLMQHVTPRLSDEDAAAILGSFGVETGGFTLREEAGGGGGYGWAQWTGSRRDDMEEWCAANGYNPYAKPEAEYDLACCAFFLHEIMETWEKRVLTDGGTISGVFYPPLNRCVTLDEKTESFWRLFERPGTPHADWRREMAREALRVYRGGEGEEIMPYQSIAISSGHGKYVRGASGILDEVNEARKVTDRLAEELRARGVKVTVFHDDTSRDQQTNLETIVAFHNAQPAHSLDISTHFNAFEQTSQPKGTEVWFYSQGALAAEVSAAIASVGLKDRGGKQSDGLYFLQHTKAPAILLEICFVDSQADADIYKKQWELICERMADVLGGVEAGTTPPPSALPRVDIEVSGEVLIFVNGVQVGTKG